MSVSNVWLFFFDFNELWKRNESTRFAKDRNERSVEVAIIDLASRLISSMISIEPPEPVAIVSSTKDSAYGERLSSLANGIYGFN